MRIDELINDMKEKLLTDFEDDVEEEYSSAVKSYILIAEQVANCECDCSIWLNHHNIVMLLNKQHNFIKRILKKLDGMYLKVKKEVVQKEILEKVNEVLINKFQYLRNVKYEDLDLLISISEIYNNISLNNYENTFIEKVCLLFNKKSFLDFSNGFFKIKSVNSKIFGVSNLIKDNCAINVQYQSQPKLINSSELKINNNSNLTQAYRSKNADSKLGQSSSSKSKNSFTIKNAIKINGNFPNNNPVNSNSKAVSQATSKSPSNKVKIPKPTNSNKKLSSGISNSVSNLLINQATQNYKKDEKLNTSKSKQNSLKATKSVIMNSSLKGTKSMTNLTADSNFNKFKKSSQSSGKTKFEDLKCEKTLQRNQHLRKSYKNLTNTNKDTQSIKEALIKNNKPFLTDNNWTKDLNSENSKFLHDRNNNKSSFIDSDKFSKPLLNEKNNSPFKNYEEATYFKKQLYKNRPSYMRNSKSEMKCRLNNKSIILNSTTIDIKKKEDELDDEIDNIINATKNDISLFQDNNNLNIEVDTSLFESIKHKNSVEFVGRVRKTKSKGKYDKFMKELESSPYFNQPNSSIIKEEYRKTNEAHRSTDKLNKICVIPTMDLKYPLAININVSNVDKNEKSGEKLNKEYNNSVTNKSSNTVGNKVISKNEEIHAQKSKESGQVYKKKKFG